MDPDFTSTPGRHRKLSNEERFELEKRREASAHRYKNGNAYPEGDPRNPDRGYGSGHDMTVHGEGKPHGHD